MTQDLFRLYLMKFMRENQTLNIDCKEITGVMGVYSGRELTPAWRITNLSLRKGHLSGGLQHA